MKAVIVDGNKVPCTIKRSAKSSAIWLKMEDENGLMVILPKGRKSTIIPQILKQNKDWVLKMIKLREVKLKSAPPSMENSKSIVYRGRKVNIKVKNVACPKPKVRLINNSIKVVMPKNSEESLSDIVTNWLKERALLFFSRRVEYFAGRLNVKFGTISVKDQKTRWGSLSSKGNLSFNWRLLFAPPEVLDYVVAHEVCHFKHYDHSERFWRLLKKIIPNYEKYREWLQENGVLLRM
jgi:predicted metal-dependent hydrolase